MIVRRIKKTAAPIDIYEESDMIIRTIRDIFTSEVDAILIDEPSAYERAKEFLQIVMPRYVNRLQLYEGKEPLFHKYKLDEEIAKINQRKVPLDGGGSIVIDQTEALVAIDVNSGNFRTDGTAEESAYQLNLIAAKEIARQLRLRDLGGVVVNDFIDMRKEKHRRGVEKTLRDAVKRDRARTKILRTSPFGLIEMTRQRIRPSLKRSVFRECPACSGSGLVKTAESMAIEVIRKIHLAAQKEQRREDHRHRRGAGRQLPQQSQTQRARDPRRRTRGDHSYHRPGRPLARNPENRVRRLLGTGDPCPPQLTATQPARGRAQRLRGSTDLRVLSHRDLSPADVAA